MDSLVMEEHIKYEAEESAQLVDHVWEEVVIEESQVPAWKQEMEMEVISTDETMESTVSEGLESSAVTLDPVTGELQHTTFNHDDTPNGQSNQEETEVVATEHTFMEAVPAAPQPNQSAEPKQIPIITKVSSLARPMHKVVNLNNLKLLPKSGFVNVGNKKMKLVTLTGGKVVAMGSAGNNKIVGKVVTLNRPESGVVPAKVVTMSPNSSAAGIVNNKVVPAKVVSVAGSKMKPIAPNNKDVMIYITGLAGDKVQIKDPLHINRLQVGDRVTLGQREAGNDSFKSDHMDACRPVHAAPTDADGFPSESGVTDGHFLLNGDMAQAFDTTNLVCHICDRQFTQLKYLLSHQQTHLHSDPVRCDLCEKRFKRRYDLLRHKRRAHADEAIYECDVCHKTFTDNALANRHRLTHTEDFKYSCEVCQRPFRYVHDLKRHRSIHFDEKPFDCEVCGKKFKHKSNLKTHQATHYSEKPYSCTLCDKRFHQKGNLKTHLIVHTGEMPFVCNICSKRFHTRSGLLNHSYSHSEEKPFQCEICEKTFNWKSGLLTHQQTHKVLQQRPPHVLAEDVEVIEIGPIPVDN